MVSLLIGIAAFVLCFLYDINSFVWKKAVMHSFFAIGAVLLTAASAVDLWQAIRVKAFHGVPDAVLLVLAAVSLAALIYSLFFALPFEETYIKNSERPAVYDKGVYALCRHPGVLFYFLMQLFFGIAALPEKVIINGLVFSGLNILYAWFQDRITFVRTFSNYPEYRNKTPFLVPTMSSFVAACKFFGKSISREGEQ